MRAEEFNRWLDDYFGRFPSVERWIRDTGRQQQVLENWQLVLADVEFTDAIDANLILACGDEPEIKPYDRDRTAYIVKSIVREREAKHRIAEEQERQRQKNGRRSPQRRRSADFDRSRFISQWWEKFPWAEQTKRVKYVNTALWLEKDEPLTEIEIAELSQSCPTK